MSQNLFIFFMNISKNIFVVVGLVNNQLLHSIVFGVQMVL